MIRKEALRVSSYPREEKAIKETTKIDTKHIYSPYKTVWRTLITSCFKELIDSLTKWLTLYDVWFIGQ